MKRTITILGIPNEDESESVINESDYVDAIIDRSYASSYVLSHLEDEDVTEKKAYINKNMCMPFERGQVVGTGSRVWVKKMYINYYN